MRTLATAAIGLASLPACSGEQTTTPKVIGKVALADTAVLFPLPAPGEEELLLRPTDTGRKGRLLPDFAIPRPALVMLEDRDTTIERLRLVAVRIDPCFPNVAATDLRDCRQALHLIWQPLVETSDAATPGGGDALTSWSTADAAVHSFHFLPASAFSSLLGELVALDRRNPGAEDPGLPLSIHPVIWTQGLSGQYYSEYRDLILAYAGEQNLERMTYFALRANAPGQYVGVGWLLAGEDFYQGRSHPVLVATTSDKEQHFGNNVLTSPPADVDSYLGDFIPGTEVASSLLAIVGDSAAAETAPEVDLEAALDTAFLIENPLLNTLDSVDCASCHVATGARLWAQRHRGMDGAGSPYRYENPAFDLRLTTEIGDKTNSLRGLGYYQADVALTQRTINDAAASASFINDHFLSGREERIGDDNGESAPFEPPRPRFTELEPATLPAGSDSVGAIVVDPASAALYAAAGSRVLHGDARSRDGTSLSERADLAPHGIPSISAMALAGSNALLVASGSNLALISVGDGSVLRRMTIPIASGPFGGPSIAASADGKTAFAVESGPGSPNADGKAVVHAFRIPLEGPETFESWELAEPFKVVPIEVGAIDATALLVSTDGRTLYVAHGVLRQVFEVDIAAPHAVRVLDLDSFQRSALAMSLAPDGIYVQAATFDQTVPVFDLAGPKGATLLAEIPVGLTPVGVASFERRIFVSMGAGFGFGPPAPGQGRIRVFELGDEAAQP